MPGSAVLEDEIFPTVSNQTQPQSCDEQGYGRREEKRKAEQEHVIRPNTKITVRRERRVKGVGTGQVEEEVGQREPKRGRPRKLQRVPCACELAHQTDTWRQLVPL